MDFTYDTEHDDLRSAVRALLQRRYPPSDGGRIVEQAEKPDADGWAELGRMGALGLTIDSDHGGMGASLVEASIVAEEIGRCLAPEPYVESLVLGARLIASAGTPEQRRTMEPALAAGTHRVVLAHLEPGALSRVTAARWSGAWELSGVKEPVVGGAEADLLVVTAEVDCRLLLFVVESGSDGLEIDGYPTHDHRRAARVSLRGAPAHLLGDDGHEDRRGLVGAALAEAKLLLCHEALGLMETAVGLTSEYLRVRTQFGKPLMAFQALTFRAADMYVAMEMARSTTMWATMAVAEGSPLGLEACHRAAVETGRAGRFVGEQAVQLHGGIGVTAEHPVGHVLSRLTAIDHTALTSMDAVEWLREAPATRSAAPELLLADPRHGSRSA
ncbi:acyl-CoA dehydrogenase family protein [Pseudonocardia xishanensis]|uniref:Acyl-CoA dehydrogenase family protein n=1 Tax=Pseudonocardia xishanensis TaxID=630995 RepID=A0ABP8RYW0_9PSEU